MEPRGQLAGVSSLLPPCELVGTRVLNLDGKGLSLLSCSNQAPYLFLIQWQEDAPTDDGLAQN